MGQIQRVQQELEAARSRLDRAWAAIQPYQESYDRQMALFTSWETMLVESGVISESDDLELRSLIVLEAWSHEDASTRGLEPRYPEAEEYALAGEIEAAGLHDHRLGHPGLLSQVASWERSLKSLIRESPSAARALGLIEPASPPQPDGNPTSRPRRGRRLKHGDARRGVNTPLRNSWRNMIQRCTNPNNPDYPRYGARGIGFDPRWWDYAAFKAEMGPTFKPGHTLDRLDVELGYSKENCRWATPRQQTHNRGVKEPRIP